MPSTPIYFAADEKLLAVLAEPLRRTGLEIETFHSLPELRAAFDRELPGALLLGARLSDSTAYTALKSLSGPRHVPTLVIVGESQLDHRGQALRLGFADVAPSPLRPRALASRLLELASAASVEQKRERASGIVTVKGDDESREAEVVEVGEQTLVLKLSPAPTEDDFVELVFAREGRAPLSLFGRVLTSIDHAPGPSEAAVRLLAMTPEEAAALREIVRPARPPPAPPDLEAEALAEGWPAGTVEAARPEPAIPDFFAEPEQGEGVPALTEGIGQAVAAAQAAGAAGLPEPSIDAAPLSEPLGASAPAREGMAPLSEVEAASHEPMATGPLGNLEPERIPWPATPEPLDLCVDAVARALAGDAAPQDGSSDPMPLERAADEVGRQLGDFERRAFEMLRAEPVSSTGAPQGSAATGLVAQAPVTAEAAGASPAAADGQAPAEPAAGVETADMTSFAMSLENLSLERPKETPAVPTTEKIPVMIAAPSEAHASVEDGGAPVAAVPVPAAAEKGLDAAVARQLREGAGHRARVLAAVTSGRTLAAATGARAPRALVAQDVVASLAGDAQAWSAALRPAFDGAVAAADVPLLVDLNSAQGALAKLVDELRELEERLEKGPQDHSLLTEGLAPPPSETAVLRAPAPRPAPKKSAGLVWAVAFLLALALAVIVWHFVH